MNRQFGTQDGSDTIRALMQMALELSENERQLLRQMLDSATSQLTSRIEPDRIDYAKAGARTLTQREREITQLIVGGLTNKEVARLLHISPRTVETHRCRIRQKLGARNIAELCLLMMLVNAHI